MVYDSKFGLALRSMLQERIRRSYPQENRMIGVLMAHGSAYNLVSYGWLEQQYRIGVTI